MTARELYQQERARREAPAVVEPPTHKPRRHYACYSPTEFRKCGHPRTPENTYTNRITLVESCIVCRKRRSSRKAFRSISDAVRVYR